MIGYGYSCDKSYDLSNILNKYSHEEIFKIVFGEEPKLDKYYCSPFRFDKNPKCYFTYSNNKLMFVDWTESDLKIKRDCIQSIRDKFNLNLNESINYIVEYFDNNNLQCSITTNNQYIKKDKIINHTPILIKSRAFNKQDKYYWESYGISCKNLLEDKVVALKWYDFYSSKTKQYKHIECKTLTYAYTDFLDNRKKIYSPYKTVGKWMTNCSKNDIGNINNIDKIGEILVITKSYKDTRVLQNLGYNNTIWFQNEGQIPNKEYLNDLSIRFKNIYILFDNDETGIRSSEVVKSRFLNIGKFTTCIYSPFEDAKDSADIYFTRGKNILKEFLNDKITKKNG